MSENKKHSCKECQFCNVDFWTNIPGLEHRCPFSDTVNVWVNSRCGREYATWDKCDKFKPRVHCHTCAHCLNTEYMVEYVCADESVKKTIDRMICTCHKKCEGCNCWEERSGLIQLPRGPAPWIVPNESLRHSDG